MCFFMCSVVLFGKGGGGLHVNLFNVFCCAAQDGGRGLHVYPSCF